MNNFLAISTHDFDNSGEPGPQAKAVNHLETPLRQLHITHRASSCAKRGGYVQLCSKPRGAHGIEPETFRRRGQLLSCPPTTGPFIGKNLTHSLHFVFPRLCYTEKAAPTRHRPERQHNARANRRKQCSPNETKPYSKPTLPRKRQTTPTNGHTPRRWKPTHTRLTYTRMRPHAPSHPVSCMCDCKLLASVYACMNIAHV